MVEKKNDNCIVVNFVFILSLIGKRGGGGVIWRVALYAGEYILQVTHLVGECFQKLVSNPALVLVSFPFKMV